MKKNLVSIVVLALVAVTFVLAGAPPIFAAEAQPSGFTALAPIPGLTDISPTAVVNSTSLANFFNNLYKYVIGLAAVLAVIMIIWGGLEYSTQDSVSKKSDGKERIIQAILGLVLVLSPVLVFSIINPGILNLSISLDPLKTSTSPPGGGGGPGPVTPTPSGCVATGATGGVLQFAVCPSADAARE